MLKIYGANLSSPSNKVRFVANALGLKYEYIQVKLREGEQRKPEFLKLNPAGKIPVIVDGDFVLSESGAIIKYLCDKNKSSYYPSDLKRRAIVDQWIDYSIIHVGAAMVRVVFNRLFAPIIKTEVDESSLKCGLEFLSRYLPILDAQLGKGKFLAENTLTLADFTLLSTLDPAEAADIDVSSHKNVAAWRKKLKAEDFYQKCHASFEEVFQKTMGAAQAR